jgi:hypothetical protein
MLFKATTIALLAASASALSPGDGIPADSSTGMKLMSQARALSSTWDAHPSFKFVVVKTVEVVMTVTVNLTFTL